MWNQIDIAWKLLIVLQLLDLATTGLAFKLGGVEWNPLYTFLVERFPAYPAIQVIIAGKFVGLVAILELVWLLGKPGAIRKANVAYTAILVWNVLVITKLLYQ